MAATAKAYRLPTTVRPTRYDIHLHLDPAKATFQGELRIALTITAATKEVALHARDLTVSQVVLGGQAATAEVRKDDELLVVRTPKAVDGKVDLDLRFEGKVGTAMAGLYLSEDGPERCLATQCEATDARAIIPCFDEPAFKARFGWRLTTPKGLVALANGRATGKKDNGDGTETWSFEATPPMSSYLIACAVGAFGATAKKTEGKVDLQVWALGGKERLGVHSRDFAARLMGWYEDYFGVPYHWGKYDQIAVPSFSFGAMENAGLVVFRPSLLLLDPKTASWRDEKGVDLVVAHEFAHMWFGNLVTMGWWDDLWLNEAFAEWICHKAVDELAPTHEVWHEFAYRTDRAMDTDALDSTHAIYHPVKTPEEAGELFDAITYGKGSATLRMLEAFLGEEAFRAGLRTYMKEFSEKNAAGDDLWRHLADASDQPVARIMESWIKQPGHPMVSVSLKAETKDAVTLTLSQKRARSAPGLAPSTQLWHVPLVLKWEDSKGVNTTRHLLTTEEETLTLKTQGALQWLHPNHGDVGFYRGRLDDALLGRLSQHYGRLDPAERRGLLRDQWALVRAGERHVAPLLGLLDRAIPQEDHYTSTEEIVGTLREIERLLEMRGETKALEALRRWVRERFMPHHERLGAKGPKGEAPGEAVRRATVLKAVAGIGRDAAAVKVANTIAAEEREHPERVDANIAGTAVAVTAMMADQAGWERHFAVYEKRRAAQAPPQQVERYLYTLGVFRDPALVARTLTLLSDAKVAKQAVGPILRGMLAEPHAQSAAWEHLKRHWDDVRKNLGDAWTNILVEASGELPPKLAEDVVTFFDDRLGGTLAQQSYGRAKESLHERTELLERVVPKVALWVQERR